METIAEKTLECPNCKRILEKKYFVKHHLVPRQKGGTHIEDNTIFLCRVCEKQLHNLYPNSKLKRDFNTLEKIINDPEMKKFGEWIGKRSIIKIKHTNKGGFHR